MNKWLTVKEVAERFGSGTHIMTVYRRIWAGELAASDVRPKGSRKPEYRVAESALQQYFADRAIKMPARRVA